MHTTDPTARTYALISPCRDEEQYLRRTLESVARQTIAPSVWVIVDDGSTDATWSILQEYAQRLPYLRPVKKPDRGGRRVGGGVIEAFNDGLRYLDLASVEFVCKLDMDLVLPATYFEHLIGRMDADPVLGTCSGKAFYVDPNTQSPVSEYCGNEMSAGMTKFYRTQCFRDIGGFVERLGWDILDCHICRMKGWRARAFSDQELAFEHLRPMGSSHRSICYGRVRLGRAQYLIGTHAVFMIISAVYRANKRPILLGSLAMLWGYFRSVIVRETRYVDPDVLRFVRRYQWRALLVGKDRAAEEARRRARDVAAA